MIAARYTHRLLFVVTCALALSFGARADAQRRGEEWVPRATEGDRALRLGGHFGLGFAGQVKLKGDAGGSADLDPTFGFGLRAELPVARHFAIGGLLEINSFNVRNGTDNRDPALDVDVWLKGRYPLDVGELKVIPYVGVPFGFTVLFVEDQDNARGFNLGALAGLELVFEHFAPYFEIGWRLHRVSRSGAGPFGGDITVATLSNQGRINFGVAVRF